MSVGKRMKDRGVDDTYQRCRQSDAKSERDDRKDRESALPPEQPQTVTDILQDCLHHAASSYVVAAVQQDRQIADSLPRAPRRALRRLAGPLVLLGAHAEVKLQFLTNLVGDRVVAEQASKAREEQADRTHR